MREKEVIMPFKHFSRLSLTTKSSSPSHGATPSTSTTNNTTTTTTSSSHSPQLSNLDRNNSPSSDLYNSINNSYPIQPTYEVVCKYSKASTAPSCKSETKRRRKKNKKNNNQQAQQHQQQQQNDIFLLGRLPLIGKRIQARQEEAEALRRNISKTAPLTERNLLEFFNPDYREVHDAFCDRPIISFAGEVSIWDWIGKLPPVSTRTFV